MLLGARKKVVAGVLRAMNLYVFVVAFWQVAVLLFFCLFLRPAIVLSFFELFLGVKKKWISASGTVFGASFGPQALVFCGFVF